MAITDLSKVRAETPSGIVPLRELEDRSRILHPGGHMHTSHAPASYEARSTTGTAAVVVVGDGQCIAAMATTHCSDVRAEMPSGMVLLRELESRSRYLHERRHMHTPENRRAPYTLFTPLMRQRVGAS